MLSLFVSAVPQEIGVSSDMLWFVNFRIIEATLTNFRLCTPYLMILMIQNLDGFHVSRT